jgi:2-polyprenyl-6-methoxyphenol hydroxylase-like FAD-dependent oxidoreductase
LVIGSNVEEDSAMRIAVVGGGISGLATCLVLARRGHDLTLFERDPLTLAADPHDAFEADRRGAPQVRHSHAFLARLRNLLRDEYPDVLQALYRAGATDLLFADGLPATVAGYEPEPGDDDLAMLACRRTTFEWVLRSITMNEGRLSVRSAEEVSGLTFVVAEPSSALSPRPQITGVRLGDGTTEDFDLTVVATGRRGALPEWLEAAGTPPIVETIDESGIVYFSRFYRLKPGQSLPPRTGPIGGDLGYVKYGVFPGDNGTFSITLAVATDDSEVRKLLNDEEIFDQMGRELVFTAPYLDGRAEAITGVHKIAGLISRWRDYFRDGEPVATGVVPVGDALLATNPLYGRGCTTGFWAAHILGESLDEHPLSTANAITTYLQRVAEFIHPWVLSTMKTDQDAREVASNILAGNDPDAGFEDGKRLERSVLRDGLRPALRSDITVLRAFMRNFNLLTAPDTVIKDADVMGRVFSAWQERDTRPPEPVLGPDRNAMLSLLVSA